MRLPRTFLIAAVIALAASFTVGFHAPLRDGPIPCLDGSTVELGQLCPVPTVQCANGTAVFLGQWCPVGPPPPQPAAQAPAPPSPPAAPPPNPDPVTEPCPDEVLSTCQKPGMIPHPDSGPTYVCSPGYYFDPQRDLCRPNADQIG